jgi:hypothetical protein
MMRLVHVHPKCGRNFTWRRHDHASGSFSTDVMGWHGNNLSRISVFGISLPLPSREVLLLKQSRKAKAGRIESAGFPSLFRHAKNMGT